MTSLSTILATAAERQAQIHSDRESARNALLVYEREDQQLQKIIKHGRAYHEALEGASPELLAAIGAAENVQPAQSVQSAEAQPAAPSPAVDDAPGPQVDQPEGTAGDETAEDSAVRPDPVAGAGTDGDAVEDIDDETERGEARETILGLLFKRKDSALILRVAMDDLRIGAGCISDVPTERYATLIERLKARIAEADAPPPPKRVTITPETSGLTEDDQRILNVMRKNVGRNGICGLTIGAAAEITGIGSDESGNSAKRLIAARRILKATGRTYRVSEIGGSFPPARIEPSAPAPVTVSTASVRLVPRFDPTPPVDPKAVDATADKMLAIFKAAMEKDGKNDPMFDLQFIGKKLDVTDLRIDHALTRLAERGDVMRLRCDLKGHVRVQLLKRDEVAA